MRSKLVLILALALLLGSSTGVLAADLSTNGGPEPAAILVASPELMAVPAPAVPLACAEVPPPSTAPAAPSSVSPAWRC